VISINGIAQPSGLIQDTIWVPSNSTVVVRVRFKGFVGKAVYHCHILPHEDTGMMQNFLIVDPTSMSHGG
jgi:FtsP/CotA-like multicopper oxidase with cupredoxin domain